MIKKVKILKTIQILKTAINRHHAFVALKKEFFSRNLGQNMPKMRIFLEKKAVNRRSAEPPNPC